MLRRFTIPYLVVVALAPSLARAQTPTSAEPSDASAPKPDESAKQEAKRRFEHAIKLYEDADYALALAEFERVYELVPDYRVLYNVGQVNIQLGRYARAFRMLHEYLDRGGSEMPPDRRRAVQADLEALAAKTAALEVQAKPDGAEITLDGAVVGTSPLVEPLVVDVGEHALQLRAAGYVTQSRRLVLAGGDRRPVVVELEPNPVSAPQPPVAVAPVPVSAPVAKTQVDMSPSPRAAEKPRWLTMGWVGTGVLAASSAVAFGLGASAASHLSDLRSSRGHTRAELDDAKSRAQTRLLVADVLGGAALAAGGAMLYFQFSSPSPSRDHASASAPEWGVQVLPTGVALRVSQ